MTAAMDRIGLRLTEACWPVFEFVTNFTRQVKHGTVPAHDQVRYEALTALRDAEDLARNDPVTERTWEDRLKAMMAYLIDYKMLNTEWAGRDYWNDEPFECDANVLNHPQALGGEEFFRDCDEMQKEFELAERRDRRDKDELAGVLGLYFICLRLGFKGQFHDRPQELADYTRRLFTRLPAYATTRAKEMFPESYKHNLELKANYSLGMNLAIIVAAFAILIGGWAFTSRWVWNKEVRGIRESAAQWTSEGLVVDAPGEASGE